MKTAQHRSDRLKRETIVASSLLIPLLFAMPPPTLANGFDCVIEPRAVLEIRAPIEGLIERVNVERGDRVHKGDELALIDSAVERAAAELARQRARMDGALQAAQSRLDFAMKKADRQQELFEKKLVATQDRDEAQTERRLAESDLKTARENRALAEIDLTREMEIIRLKTIRSPVDGIVTERILSAGELAEAGVGRKPIVKLADIETLYVEAFLPVEAFGKVSIGMEGEVRPEVPVGAVRTAKVVVVDQVFDAASGTFGVRLALPNGQHDQPAGVKCMAEFPDVALGSLDRLAIVPRSNGEARNGVPALSAVNPAANGK